MVSFTSLAPHHKIRQTQTRYPSLKLHGVFLSNFTTRASAPSPKFQIPKTRHSVALVKPSCRPSIKGLGISLPSDRQSYSRHLRIPRTGQALPLVRRVAMFLINRRGHCCLVHFVLLRFSNLPVKKIF